MNLSETSEVLSAISELRNEGRPMALATIVSVKGSTYRRPGARLLVPDRGEAVGNLSGGCLEGEVEAIGRDVMKSGDPRLEFYDLTADDEVVWGWGLGCNGAIEVFVEPADRAAQSAEVLNRAIVEGRTIAFATVIESDIESVEAGARILLYDDGDKEGALGDAALERAVVEESERALVHGTTDAFELETSEGRARVFIEVLRPPLRLLICGAGHDAIPLVKQAAALGWRVDVADDRGAFLDSERYPEASGFVETQPADVARTTQVDERTHVVVMTHNFLRDRDYLKALLPSKAPYIGMLGPHARLERLLDELAREGITPDPDQLARVHGPAGLDVGGEGPEEIAAAIVAEILAVSRGRGAGFLRERTGPIHDRPEAVPG